MKKLLVMLGVMLFSASVFALNSEVLAGDCDAKRAEFEKNVASQQNGSFIVQNILINMADPMELQSDEKAKADAICYATYRVRGLAFVDFVRANADIFRKANSQNELAASKYDEMQRGLLHFADRVERLAEQEALDTVASHGNNDWVVEHILGNLADPMAKMSDEEAAPKARVYKKLKVKSTPLMMFVSQQAHRLEANATNAADDLTDFANRVEMLAK